MHVQLGQQTGRCGLMRCTSQSRKGGWGQVKDSLPVGEQVCHLLALCQASFQVLHCSTALIHLHEIAHERLVAQQLCLDLTLPSQVFQRQTVDCDPGRQVVTDRHLHMWCLTECKHRRQLPSRLYCVASAQQLAMHLTTAGTFICHGVSTQCLAR